MRWKPMLTAVTTAAACLAIPAALSATPAEAATAVITLPITQYSHMLVDAVHQHLFITSGSGSTSILVTDYSGHTVATIPNEPGATGLALSTDGSTVYAALPGDNAISAISTSTLAETARYSTGANTGPTYVAYTSGKIWFGYSGATDEDGGIGSVDPSTSPATITLNATPDSWYFAPMVTASPAGELVAGEPSQEPIELASYDVSSGTATALAPQQLVQGTAYLWSFQITPDGADVITASSSPYYLQVFRISDLAQVGGDYVGNSTSFPNSVSISSDGSVAAGTTADTSTIYLFAPGGTSPENVISFGSNSLANDGVALTPDGSELFAITLSGGPTGTPQLNIISNPLPMPAGSVPASGSPVVINASVPLTGALTVSVAINSGVTLTPNSAGTVATGSLPDVSILDTRNNFPGWQVFGQESAFTGSGTSAGDSISGNQLGWAPAVSPDAAAGAPFYGATAGPLVAPASPGIGSTAAELADDPAGLGPSQGATTVSANVFSAALTLDIPAFTVAGPYSGSLTITYMSAD